MGEEDPADAYKPACDLFKVGHGKGNASDDNHLYDRRKMLSGKDLCDSAV